MKIVKEDKGQQVSVLKVSVGKEDYSSSVDSALKEQQKKAKLDGFRPGKVPVGVVKKMYGTHYLVEEVNKLVSKGLSDYITENKIHLLGEPLPNETEQSQIDWENNSEYEFCYDIAIAPELSLKLNAKTSSNFYQISVDDAKVTEQIDNMCSRFGSQIPVDITDGTEIVRGTLVQVDAKGKVMEDGHSKESASLLISVIRNEEKKAQFIGKKNGNEIVFSPMDTLENEAEVSSFLNVSKEAKELLDSKYKFTISEIQRFQKAEVNQELFDKVFGEGEVKSEEELRAKIKTDMESRFVYNSDYKLMVDMRDKLVEANPMELPQEFLKRWLISINRGKEDVTPEKIEEEMPNFLTDVKWQLVKNQLITEAEISIKPEEMIAAAKDFARMQLQQFGMFNPADEEVTKWGMEILKNQEEARRLAEVELDKKLVEYFKKTIKLVNKQVTLEEFNEFFKN